ncbi:MAG: hypothetical protein ACEQSE_11415 [Candidatus Aquirickettsiella gammari]
MLIICPINVSCLYGNCDWAEILKYTWSKLYSSHAYNACSVMPRYGAGGILTEQQMQDVMALLLDPKSPINQ